MRRTGPVLLWATLLSALLFPGMTRAQVSEFGIPSPCSPAPAPAVGTCQPAGITAGPDGALWFTQENGNRVARMNTAGQITLEVTLPSGSLPAEIVSGPDGRLWFTLSGRRKIAAITTGGQVTEYPSGATTGAAPDGITVGPDNNLWFTESNQGGTSMIGRMTTAGTIVDEYSLPSGSGAADITVGPDGALWFTESDSGQVGRIDTNGLISRPPGLSLPGSDPSGITSSAGALWFAQAAANKIGRAATSGILTGETAVGAGPSSITTGSDGALWFTESVANKIGRMTTTGVLTNEFTIPTPNADPSGIASGPDGALWFTENVGNKIGRIAVAPPFVPPPPPPPAVTPAAKKKCKVPKLKGLTLKKARKKLKKAKCKYRVRGKGRVRSTVPKAGRTTTKAVVVKFKRKKARRR